MVVEVEPWHGVLQERDDRALEVESARVLVRSRAHLLHDAILVRKPTDDKIRIKIRGENEHMKYRHAHLAFVSFTMSVVKLFCFFVFKFVSCTGRKKLTL